MGLPINKVKPIIEEIVDQMGFVLYDVEEDKLGSNDVMRVLVQRQAAESVDLDDCVKITHGLTAVLDDLPELANEYMLEVASPGIIRNLLVDFHFEQVIGQTIEVKVKSKVEGFDSKNIVGKLVSFNEQTITLEGCEIERSNIAKAATTFEF